MEIRIYRDIFGFSLFEEWLKNLNDKTFKGRILARLDRIEEGNLGDHKFLKDGIWELRFTFGAGIRIYFGKLENKVIILILGGDKSSQRRDIQKAVTLFKDYLRNQDEI